MDYYSTLGVEPNATESQIKSAFKTKAKESHPDLGGDAEKFKQLNEAYDTLKDPQKRAAYDHMRRGPAGGIHININGTDHDVFNDVFSDLGQVFGQRFRQRAPRQKRNRDLNISLRLNIRELVSVVDKTISVRHTTGERKVINVSVPAGVVDGMTLKYPGLGDSAIPNVEPGNLFVQIHVEQDPNFQQRDTDLLTNLTIDAFQAMTGITAEIISVDYKKIKLKIPAGTQYGTVMKVSGYGLLDRTGNRGNLLVTILVKIPENLTQERLNTIRQLMGGIDIEV